MFVLREKTFIQCVRLVLVDHVHHYDHSGPEKNQSILFFIYAYRDRAEGGAGGALAPPTFLQE